MLVVIFSFLVFLIVSTVQFVANLLPTIRHLNDNKTYLFLECNLNFNFICFLIKANSGRITNYEKTIIILNFIFYSG